MEIKTYYNKIVVAPDNLTTDIEGLIMSEDEISGTFSGTVVAVASSITDIKVGDKLFYSKKSEEIIIFEKRHHIVMYQNAYWGYTPDANVFSGEDRKKLKDSNIPL